LSARDIKRSEALFIMTRGKPTDQRLASKAKGIVAKTGDVSLASQKTGVPLQTVYDLIDDDKFIEFRKRIEQEQIMKICKVSLSVAELIERKVNEMLDQESLKDIRIKELTSAVKDLRDSVKEVKDNQINIESLDQLVIVRDYHGSNS